jgi:GGDEF domain-containing protein
MIRRADEALYQAKAAGRNCVRWHKDAQILASATWEHSAAAIVSTDCSARERSQPTSFTTFNRELTRHVCGSRRSSAPLSVIYFGVDASVAGAIDTPLRGSTLTALGELIRAQLQNGELLAEMGAAELILMLPQRGQRAALPWVEAKLSKREFRAFAEQHGARIRHETAQLSPQETAEELIVRAREGLLNSCLS